MGTTGCRSLVLANSTRQGGQIMRARKLFILNRESTFTLPLGVQAFASQYSVDTAKVLAFTSLSMIPALVFFSLFQRRIVGGLTGAVKG
jgi:raffinose/stachyose/melibiose transport system permease protein